MVNESNNIYLNPQFCDFENDNYFLYDSSPCIGAGEGGANIGAYGVGCELVSFSGPTWFVSNEGSDNNNGSELTPFATIQKAIEHSDNGDTIFLNTETILLVVVVFI